MAMFPTYVPKREFHDFLFMLDAAANALNVSRSQYVTIAICKRIAEDIEHGRIPSIDTGIATRFAGDDNFGLPVTASATTVQVGYIRTL